MSTSMKSMNKAMSVAQSVARKSVKVFGAALPVVSVGVTGLTAWQESGGNLPVAGQRFLKSFTGVDQVTGLFRAEDAAKGLGSLLISTVAGWIVRKFA